MENKIKLTVFFDGTFWSGMFERERDGVYEASRVVFGAEPKDYDVYSFVLRNFYKIRFGGSIQSQNAHEVKKISFKKLQKKIKKEMETDTKSTKAQAAVKLEYEQNKVQRKTVSHEEREKEKERQFEIREHKKLKKHQGH